MASQYPLTPEHIAIREFFQSEWSYDVDDFTLGPWMLIDEHGTPPLSSSGCSDLYLWRTIIQGERVIMGQLWDDVVVSESGGRYNLTDENDIDAWQPLPETLASIIKEQL